MKTQFKILITGILLTLCGTSFAHRPLEEIKIDSNVSGYLTVTNFDLGDKVISQVENTKTNEILFQNEHDKKEGKDTTATPKELLKLEEFKKLTRESRHASIDKKGLSNSRGSQRVTCTYTHTSYPMTGDLEFDVSHPTYHFSCDNGGSATITVITSTSAYLNYIAP